MLSHLIRSKGLANITRRGVAIAERVGPTPAHMLAALRGFSALLATYGAPATFPVTALTLARNPGVLRQLLSGPARVELAVHGCRHVDHTGLPGSALPEELRQAARTFRNAGIAFNGFRAPYLRWSPELLAALGAAGFQYDSSWSVSWPVIDWATCTAEQRTAVQILLDFCRPRPAEDAPVLPVLLDGLVELPVSFPDDEMLVERLGFTDPVQQAAVWQAVLAQSHARGELFVLQLHPERFFLCAAALEGVLRTARTLQPSVWIATLGEIAAWWRLRQQAHLSVAPRPESGWHVTVEGSEETAVLLRNVSPDGTSLPWDQRHRLVAAHHIDLPAGPRPVVGLPVEADAALRRLLADEGYIVDAGAQPGECAVYLDRRTCTDREARAVLAAIDDSSGPLVRLARWPAGARSALAITGDIDALTWWDYGLRLIGR